MPARLLPREGLTLEAAYAPFRATVLNPFVTGPLLLALLKYPHQVAQARDLLSPALRDLLTRWSPGTKTLKFLLAWGALRVFNNWFSRKTVNNWTSDVYDWQKEIVLVTGGNSGIGKLVVEDFASRGITVIILDVSEPKSSPPQNAHFYKCDITSEDAVKEAASKIRSAHGAPTVVINNAGIGTGMDILSEPLERIHLTMNVNLIAHFIMAKEFVPSMVKANHGHIVTIASMASYGTNAQNGDYAASKAGVLSFHECLTVELSERYGAPKVRTSIFHPIWIKTPLILNLADSPNFKDFLLEPETVSDAIVERVLSGEGGQVFVPGRFAAAPLLRALPQWVGHRSRREMADTLKDIRLV